jgi:predicted PurR-regulated permease PerM
MVQMTDEDTAQTSSTTFTWTVNPPAATVFAALGVWWLASRLTGLIGWLIISLFLSFALEPGVNFLAKHGWRRGLATGFVMLAVFVAIIGLFVLVVPVFVRELTSFVDNLPQTLQRVSNFTESCCKLDLTDPKVLGKLASLDTWVKALAGNALAVGSYMIQLLFSFLSIATFTFFLLLYASRFRRAVCSILTPRRQEIVLHTWEVAIDKTGGYLYSRALLALLSAIFHTTAFSVIGLRYPVALGIWVGLVSQFLPVIGTYLAGLLPVISSL